MSLGLWRSVRLVAAALVLAMLLMVGVLEERSEAASPDQCWSGVAIQSLANGNFVSAELQYTGDNWAELRARNGWVGPWEKFTVCRNPESGLTTIKSDANGEYVSAEFGYIGSSHGMLRARNSWVGPWERFYTDAPPTPGGRSTTAIRSAATWELVSAELGFGGADTGLLRARASEVGPWERFSFWL